MKKAVIVVGLNFGDEGKGSVVDAVCREIRATLVVKFNGGPQAAHRVVLPDGRSHVFSQFGSGTLAAAGTFISKFCSFEPIAFINEADALESIGHMRPFDTVLIDGEAPMITPYHKALNRLREWSRGGQRHGSCGMGVGELAADLLDDVYRDEVIRAKDLMYSRDILREKLRVAYERKRQIVAHLPLPRNVLDVDTELDVFRMRDPYARRREDRWIARFESFAAKATILRDPVRFSGHQNLVLEGAQGVLLDETFGFHPHTTWSNCTPDNALALLHGSDHHVTVLGVTRAYATRHGAGPFPTEDARLWTQLPPEAENHTDPFQGEFRVGHLDAVLLRYAIDACQGRIDGLAVTHLDAPLKAFGLATRYNDSVRLTAATTAESLSREKPHYRAYVGEGRHERFLRGIEMETQRPVMAESFGLTARDKRFTAAWREKIEARVSA